MSEQPWSLVQYHRDGNSDTRVGVLSAGHVRRGPGVLAGLTMLDVLDRWTHFSPQLRDIDLSALPAEADAVLLAPVTHPRAVICAGANYYDHAAEMGTQPPAADGTPFFFLKPPTTTVTATGAHITLPEASDVDWEVELGVVIGVGGKDVDEADAMAHVAGYTVANDLSARRAFPRADAVLPPFAWDWFQHKAFDGSCPLGPGIVPAWLVEDPHALDLTLSVNGQVKQSASTSDMVIRIPRLLAAASRVVTLQPGDVILTGTPAGVGMPAGTFLHPGDVVRATIEGLGTIENTMVPS